jgi:hypothetical protein
MRRKINSFNVKWPKAVTEKPWNRYAPVDFFLCALAVFVLFAVIAAGYVYFFTEFGG